ncbi:TPA: hypothetical protein DIV49_01670 [Candidatus Saccharibacteria bacterium]|nr:hypothetical protein [Candidatus Saccharibacteria bacterium]HRJ90760.1 hypothetical protein [Candidatus Saccharibacteria bacterium]
MTSDGFDPEAIAAGLRRKARLMKVQVLCSTLMPGSWDLSLREAIDELALLPAPKGTQKLPSRAIGELTLRVYPATVEKVGSWQQALEEAIVYEFPEGAVVTRLTVLPLVFRVDCPVPKAKTLPSKSVTLRRNDKTSRWVVIGETGFKAVSGRRAGSKSMGRGPDKSL